MSRTLTRDIPVELFHAQIRIRAPLRCDGVGSLDAAEDVGTGTRLAVRWLPLEAKGEAALEALLKLPLHPNLPRVVHSGKTGNRAYVALDFPEGQLLSQTLGRPLSADRIAHVGMLMADALAAIHALGMTHGQFCGESILMTGDNKALLWDLPLVLADRLTDRRGEQRLMSLLPRTCAYFSPQRARGEAFSESADVYSLGAALCFAAGAPLPEGSTLQILHQVGAAQWAPTVPEHLPQGLRDVLLHMTANEEHARPNAEAVSRSLAAYCLPPSSPAPKLAATLFEASMPSASGLSEFSDETGFDCRVLSDLPPFGIQTDIPDLSARTPVDFVLASTSLTWDARAKDEKKVESLLFSPAVATEEEKTTEEDTHTQADEFPESSWQNVPDVALPIRPAAMTRQQWMLLAGGVAAAILLAVGTFFAFSSKSPTPNNVLEADTETAPPATPKVKLPDFNYDDPPSQAPKPAAGKSKPAPKPPAPKKTRAAAAPAAKSSPPPRPHRHLRNPCQKRSSRFPAARIIPIRPNLRPRNLTSRNSKWCVVSYFFCVFAAGQPTLKWTQLCSESDFWAPPSTRILNFFSFRVPNVTGKSYDEKN